MADLIIEAKRRNLSGLNFSPFRAKSQQTKVEQPRIGSRASGVECGLYASQTETAYETKSQTTSKKGSSSSSRQQFLLLNLP